ncbi:hypothetical protein ACFOWB_12355 [Chenggangzhangella methanolivorans]
MGAVVNVDGSLDRGTAGASSFLIGGITGNYEIGFDRDVSHCYYSVSISNGPGYFAFTQERFGNPNAVFVGTHRMSGTSTVATNVKFRLIVFCPAS